MSNSDSEDNDSEADLSKLLAALAFGARAVHSLPLEDDYLYEATYSEFNNLILKGKHDLRKVLSLALQQDMEDDDPSVWDACADACDWLLEQAESYLRDDSQMELTHWSQTARNQAQSTYFRVTERVVDMVKPQITYNMNVDNDRTTPFLPCGIDSSLLKPGRANDTQFGGSNDISFLSEDMIGPGEHVPHQRRQQILNLNCKYSLPLKKPKAITEENLQEQVHFWIDTVDKLSELVKKLENVTRIAVDLEAHNYRSFDGFTCLMQVTIEQENGVNDYLIDTLALWHHMHKFLAPVFENPKILKIMHGADSDIAWLQRDFGIYVVNLLDTGRAARLLKLPSFSLMYLFKSYIGLDIDKSHQLSDWRQRPLPDSMLLYAKMDTHYLIDIAMHLLWDIQNHSSPEVTVDKLFEASQQVCLIRYDKAIFRVNGYKSLIRNTRKAKLELTKTQEAAVRSLYEWRDSVARNCDESPHYVCPNNSLLRLAMACPTSVTALQSLLNPMPPLVLHFSHDILKRFNDILKEPVAFAQNQSSSAFFFKPAEPIDETSPRGLLSPVLGTEALYKEAGWMTPSAHDSTHALAEMDPDDEKDGSEQENVLLVDRTNSGYRTTSNHSSHSLASCNFRERIAHGLGPANALSDDVEAAAERAQRVATNVRSDMGVSNLIGLIATTSEMFNNDVDDEELEELDDFNNKGVSETELEVPRSMREIYKISNRNRRNKNNPLPESMGSNVSGIEEMEVDTIEGADAILAARGVNYFDSSSKRQKQDEEEGGNQPYREDDVAFMQRLGWVKDAEEVESLRPRPRADSEDFEGDEEKAEGDKDVVKQFDYSSVGNIGVLDPNAPPSANPFFAGAAVAGGGSGFNQGSTGPKREKAKREGKVAAVRTDRGMRQEKPEKRDGKTFVYKKK